jgi:hypothetical protein
MINKVVRGYEIGGHRGSLGFGRRKSESFENIDDNPTHPSRAREKMVSFFKLGGLWPITWITPFFRQLS